MASAADHVNEFKNLTLRDIRLYRDQIKEFLDTTYGTAENAVERLFIGNDPDVLKNLDEMNTLLKVCRERLVVVANSIPINTTESSEQSDQCSSGTKVDWCIEKMSVVFNKQYPVKILAPGSPSRFWLYLESTSTESIERELEMTYRNCSPLIIQPTPGVYVVCLHSEKYCRGKVITTVELNVAASTVDVILIDYGEIVTTTISKLYPMEIKFCQEPAYGLLCCLNNLEPANQNWNVDAIIFFNQLCENITATFHPPPKEYVNTEAFSIFFPDYYVSLQKRNCKENTDIRLAMISEGMGTSSRPLESPQTLSDELLNSPLGPSSEKKSVKKMNLKPMASPYSSLKTNGTVENYVIPESSVGKSSALNQLVEDSSKYSATDPLNFKNSSLKLQNQSVLQDGKKQSVLNAKAEEFISIRSSTSIPSAIHQCSTNIQHERPSQYENFTEVNQTSHCSSANVGKSSDSTNQAPKIRAVPLNGFTKFPVANHLDDVDDLFFIPYANRAEPVSSYDSEPSSDPTLFDEPFPQPSDPQLLNKFLDCVNHAIPFHSESFLGINERETFVAATSRIQLSSNLESFHGKFSPERELQKTCISLDYQYGSVLKPKPLPMLGNSGVETIQFYFSHVISPTHFYVHLFDDSLTVLKPLNERLNQLYENSKEVPVTKPDVGSFWVVKDPQTLFWVRVKILSVDINDEIGWKTEGKTKTPTCKVFLVDWGDVNVVAISQLRPLVKEILNIPCIAFRCRLGGIYPFERSKNLDEWSSQVADTFVELAGIEQEQTAFVSVSNLGKDGAISILLFKDGNEEKYSVNELLVFLRCASSDVFQPPAKFQGADNESEWDDPMYEDYFSPMNTPALDTENYDSVTTGYIPKDEKRICRFYAAKGSCYKGVKCDQLHIRPHKDAFTEDLIEVYCDVPSFPSLVSGSLIHIQVTCVSNAFRFYAILPYGTRNLENISTDDDDDETLESLQESLQKEYTSNYYTHRIIIVPPAGDVVIAKSPEDNRWYRGRVMEERENDYLAIYFLDYGNVQLVHLRNLCNPLARFIHFPAQAMEMFLNGIDTSAAADTIQARNVLVSLVKNRDLVARVVHTIPFVCVNLYNTDPYEIDIAKEMIRLKAISEERKKPFCLYKRGKEVPG